MIKVGKSYAPSAAKLVKGGRYTQFTLPQQHRVADRYWNDGFINVLVEGDYTFHDGDTITILEITAVSLRYFKRKQYFSVYAKIDYKTYANAQAKANLQTLEDDIPDELF